MLQLLFGLAQINFLGKTDIYTKESLDILSTALAKVRSAITSGDKEAIESAYAQLTEAIDKLVKIDADKKLVLVKGSVPGCEGRLVTIVPSRTKWN